jgi:hypothetical protein
MNRQKTINKLLGGIKNHSLVYNKYGKILKISMFHLLVFLDIFIPSFRLLTLLGLKFKHIELMRITIKNK